MNPSKPTLGQTSEVTITVTRRRGWREVIRNEDGSIYLDASVQQSRWTLEGTIKTFGFVSKTIAERPPATGVTTDSFTIIERITCSRAGGTSIHYEATILVQTTLRAHYDDGSVRDQVGSEGRQTLFNVAHIECVLPAIVASAAPPLTTYTLSPEIPSATFFAWSGANCGSVTDSITSTMVWNHGQQGCEHAGEAHPDAEISVLVSGTFPVSGESFELRCTYVSAASGEGDECTLAR